MRRLATVLAIGMAAAVLAFAADDGWARWRGPFENGMARGDAPLRFSDKERVAWKVEIPGRGHSTPVVWGDRIFLTTAVTVGAAPQGSAAAGGRGGFGGGGGPQAQHKLMVMAFDRKSGKQLWERVAHTVAPHEGFHSQYGSFASNSPVVDGKHLIAFFGSRGVYCYTHDGQLVWEKDFGLQMRMLMSFGEGSAPALDGDSLVLLYDHEGDSFLAALDKNTGKELWRTARPPGSSWSTPLITVVNGKKQVIVPATKFTAGYELETGKLVWQARGLGRNVIPMTAVSDGVAYVMSGYQQPNLLAIRLGREGDLTNTDAILWQNQRGNSYTASPVLYEGKYYFVTDNGTLSCLDAKTGTAYYAQQRLPKPYSFKASPVGANGKLYLATEDGDVVVVKMGEKYEVLATNTMEGESFIASPVIVDGEIYLRSRAALFCIR